VKRWLEPPHFTRTRAGEACLPVFERRRRFQPSALFLPLESTPLPHAQNSEFEELQIAVAIRHPFSARADTQVRPYNDNAVEIVRHNGIIARSSVGAHLRVRPLSIHGHGPSRRTHRSAPTKCNAVFFLAPCRRQGRPEGGFRGPALNSNVSEPPNLATSLPH
jgi:hypothetical protein